MSASPKASVPAYRRLAKRTTPKRFAAKPLVVDRGAGKSAAMNYVQLYKAAPQERIAIVEAGLPASQAKQIISDLAMPVASAFQALHVSVSTINRKAKAHEVLPRDETERFLGLAKLIGQVQAMVEESGDPEGFDARAWTARWLNEPLPAIGGARPVDLIGTMEGQALVADTLARIQTGAYA
jgi:putative toxin-antitoxin system antitoxin component (TIGR02293 family)